MFFAVPDTNDFRREVELQRPYLLRYASVQLRNADAVEDVVQDTLVAALAGERSFAGRSNLRTWLTGILKHKIIDAIRLASRQVEVAQDAEGDGTEFDALFKANGHWVEHPAGWQDPDAALEQKRFFEVLERCLHGLPARTSRAFLMREHLGAETGEICEQLGITQNHCFVLLFRARMALQQCLDANWFGK
jgi:RNA polymerase sigma-70 factor (ECF subfamily)